MLTGDLVRAKVSGATIRPSFVGEGRPAIHEAAGELLDVFREGAEGKWRREQLDEAVDAVIGDNRDHKLLHGLAKVLADRSEFSVESPIPPLELRIAAFRLARERGPLAFEAGPLARPTSSDVFTELESRLGHPADTLAELLYADRREEQRLVSCDVPSAEWLVQRYDVALAQSLLLHASEVRVFLEEPTVPRVRQLFRWVKFHQLVHTVQRVGNELHVHLDGPMSLFGQSTRYGMQLAQFLPALLLQEFWSLQATVLWTKAKHEKTFDLTYTDGLTSHLADTGTWTSREQQSFAERFPLLNSPWKLLDAIEPIDLDGRGVIMPDFTFTDGKRTAHLELVGFWRKDWLARRLELLTAHGPKNLILAVSRKLLTSKEGEKFADNFPGEVVPFSEVIPPKAILAAIEKVAR